MFECHFWCWWWWSGTTLLCSWRSSASMPVTFTSWKPLGEDTNVGQQCGWKEGCSCHSEMTGQQLGRITWLVEWSEKMWGSWVVRENVETEEGDTISQCGLEGRDETADNHVNSDRYKLTRPTFTITMRYPAMVFLFLPPAWYLGRAIFRMNVRCKIPLFGILYAFKLSSTSRTCVWMGGDDENDKDDDDATRGPKRAEMSRIGPPKRVKRTASKRLCRLRLVSFAAWTKGLCIAALNFHFTFLERLY